MNFVCWHRWHNRDLTTWQVSYLRPEFVRVDVAAFEASDVVSRFHLEDRDTRPKVNYVFGDPLEARAREEIKT